MATQAHAVYCFEALAASFDKRKPPSLSRIEQLWDEYVASTGLVSRMADAEEEEEEEEQDADEDAEEDADDGTHGKNKASMLGIPNALTSDSTNSSTPSLQSKRSSSASSAHGTPASSASASATSLPPRAPLPPSPMFVTWSTLRARGAKQLRGCIGTFEPQDVERGLHTYALTSAFEDSRFAPMAPPELPALRADVTLLTDFEPAPDPLAWTLGTHGLRLSFSHAGRRLGATYLPDVAREQGWSKEEAVVSLMRKAGWNGRAQDWRRVRDIAVVRYQGRKAGVDADAWRAFRAWCEARGAL